MSINKHKIVPKSAWEQARKELLEEEKELTKLNDALTQKRMQLPWTPVEEEYLFETDKGKKTLAELFEGRSQLLIYHFMFGPDYQSGCPSCSAIADGFNGIETHLKNHDVMFWAVSRAPLEKLNGYKKRMGWNFPWASSFESNFNFDFGVSFNKEQQQEGIIYNFRQEKPVSVQDQDSTSIPSKNTSDGSALGANMAGTDIATYGRERPGMSAFIKEDDKIYRTYSAYARGLDALWNAYQWLDRAPKGRNEDGYWWQRHDEYGSAENSKNCCH